MLNCSPNNYNYHKEYDFAKKNINTTSKELQLLISILHSQELHYSIHPNKIYIRDINYTKITHHLLENYCVCFNHYYLLKLNYNEWENIYTGEYHIQFKGRDVLIDFTKNSDGALKKC